MHELCCPKAERNCCSWAMKPLYAGPWRATCDLWRPIRGRLRRRSSTVSTSLGPEAQVYVEYSVNEKVSMETACAAAVSGVRSLCSMKHVGLNVAADAFMTLAYVGVKAGMVMVSADDPSLHSSQNEQDNRYYAKMAGVPMLEPSTPEEARVMILEALELSEKYHIPCLLRTTTRVNHCRGPVSLGELPEQAPVPSFQKDPFNLVVVPMVGRKLRLVLLEKLERLQAEAERSALNWSRVTANGGSSPAACRISTCRTPFANWVWRST